MGGRGVGYKGNKQVWYVRENATFCVRSSALIYGSRASGKHLRHPVVYMVRLNSEGKIMQMREYFESMHIHGHIKEHKA